jgi:hypothetical protein
MARAKFNSIPTTQQHKLRVRRILAIAGRATPMEWEEGQVWYQTAHTFAVGLARRYGMTTAQTSGIIAALSPQTSWERNMTLAETFCRTGNATGPYGANLEKAARIRNGEEPLTVLGGNKVRAFYTCILTPQTSHEVVVDRHAYALAEGLIWVGNGAPSLLQRERGYEVYASAYREAAEELGVLPHVIQAVTWLTWRNLKKEVNAPQPN